MCTLALRSESSSPRSRPGWRYSGQWAARSQGRCGWNGAGRLGAHTAHLGPASAPRQPSVHVARVVRWRHLYSTADAAMQRGSVALIVPIAAWSVLGEEALSHAALCWDAEGQRVEVQGMRLVNGAARYGILRDTLACWYFSAPAPPPSFASSLPEDVLRNGQEGEVGERIACAETD
ncbi:hypothetical protein BD413DRAFT_268765 [Trametes elegans]|nr:hypothetical protein BD413DRAFT_268765 [Trametes elegans]